MSHILVIDLTGSTAFRDCKYHDPLSIKQFPPLDMQAVRSNCLDHVPCNCLTNCYSTGPFLVPPSTTCHAVLEQILWCGAFRVACQYTATMSLSCHDDIFTATRRRDCWTGILSQAMGRDQGVPRKASNTEYSLTWCVTGWGSK